MSCSCASAIVAEMSDWTALGGGNSGCCGNAAHTYGFHLPANALPTSDYSRSHEAARPYNMDWACAGDFGHSGKPMLRLLHLSLLNRLMSDDPALSMICEFIGQPWVGKPVYYWARWDGVTTLQRYTGDGHDTWSHISWWRSRANERAYLWKPGGGGNITPSVVTPTPAPTAHPAYPGYLMRYNPSHFDGNVRTWQRQMLERGWDQIGAADGYFGDKTRTVVHLFQQEKNLGVDDIIGKITWNAAWEAPVT